MINVSGHGQSLRLESLLFQEVGHSGPLLNRDGWQHLYSVQCVCVCVCEKEGVKARGKKERGRGEGEKERVKGRGEKERVKGKEERERGRGRERRGRGGGNQSIVIRCWCSNQCKPCLLCQSPFS